MNISADEVPTPKEVKFARSQSRLTQAQAAALVHLGTYQRWAEYERGTHAIDLARWELFLILTNQHPGISVTRRRAIK